jgi:hypothetical protein
MLDWGGFGRPTRAEGGAPHASGGGNAFALGESPVGLPSRPLPKALYCATILSTAQKLKRPQEVLEFLCRTFTINNIIARMDRLETFSDELKFKDKQVFFYARFALCLAARLSQNPMPRRG